MLYVETDVAAVIFGIGERALQISTTRNSSKYPFVRLQNAGTRSRGGVKLLFGVDVTDMMAAINTKKCNPNVCVYVFKNGKYEAVEFTKILKNGDEFGGNLTANLDENGVNINSALKTQRTQAAQDIKARIAYADTKKGAIALEKERILKAYERAKKSGVKSLNFIKNINANPTFFLKLSANKLFAWQRAYKENGFAGLIDERKSNRENIIDALGLSEIAQKFILSTDKKIDAPNLAMRLNEHLAVDMMDAKSMLDLYRADGAIISEGAARRFIASWRKNSANAIKDAVRRYGVDKTRGLLMPGYGNASWCAKSINEIVEIDATKLDLICTDELMGELLNFDERAKKIQSRFSIISMIDVYSRVRVFEICDSENTLAVQKCIAKYILTYGKPRIIHGDNGKAFLSKALQSACENLGIEYKKSKPYSGWQKPHIERSFGVLQNRLSAAMANYIGNDVARRKSLEGLYGMSDAKKGEKTRLKNLMDISEFERVLDEYCFSVIPNLAINSGDEKIIPLQRFNAKKDEAIRIDEAQLNALIGGLVLRSANGKKGISYGGTKFIPSEYITGQIYVAPNLNDISQIFIFDEDRNFICVGANLGSNIDASAAKKYQKAFESTLKKAQKQVQEARSYSQIKKLEAIEFASSNLPKIAPLEKINSAVGEKIKTQVQKAINLTKNAPNLDEYLAKAAGASNARANSAQKRIKSIRELIASGEI